jgi:hypothetical protein
VTASDCMALNDRMITLDNKFQKFFVSLMNMLLIYLLASMKLEKGHKKNYLALVLKLCYHYNILQNKLNIIRNGGLNKK